MQPTNGTYTIKTQRIKYMTSDLVMTFIAFFAFDLCRWRLLPSGSVGGADLWDFLSEPKMILEQLLVPPLLFVVYWISGYYNKPLERSRLHELEVTLLSSLFNAMAVYLLLLTDDTGTSKTVTATMLILLIILFMGFVYSGRLAITSAAIRHYSRIRFDIPVLVIGCSEKALKVGKHLSDSQKIFNYRVAGYIRIPGETDACSPDATVFDEEEIDRVCEELEIHQIIIAPEVRQDRLVLSYLDKAIHLDIPVRIAPDTVSVITSGIKLNDIMAEPFVDLTSPRMSEFSKNIKQTADLVLSLVALAVLSPLMAVLAILVKAGSEGSVIYSQKRVGKHRKPFRIYKFRSMVTGAEAEGPQLSYDNDPRITRVGSWMRKYRLDELPQLWNVLRGDMSIVGPRPEREYYVRRIMEQAPYYCLIFQAKPGLTSWGMVKFGYASTVGQMVERARYDLIYLSNMSISVDIKIMIYTIRTILSGSGK